MADIIEYPIWEETVREVGEGEPVTGGRQGTVNYSLQDLANRTLWLRQRSDEFSDGKTVNGTLIKFDQGESVETDLWGKARNITVSDASGTHSGAPVSVNGSQAVTLVLPGTITAALIGNVTGNVTGDVTGHHTGDVTGDVDGNVNGNAGSADKLSSQHSINGTTFDGTSDIETARWGKARNIVVQDADGSNKAAAVSVNGSANVTLKLPGIIKATVKGQADTANDVTSAALIKILKAVYPVGAIYASKSSTSPATLFGFGTWSKIEDRFLLGASSTYTAGSTGGEATHKLTVAELPAHNHSVNLTTNKTGDHCHGTYGEAGTGPWGNYETGPFRGIDGGDNDNNHYNTSTDGAHSHTVKGDTGNAGSGTAHNNMPPYFSVYMWQRTA